MHPNVISNSKENKKLRKPKKFFIETKAVYCYPDYSRGREPDSYSGVRTLTDALEKVKEYSGNPRIKPNQIKISIEHDYCYDGEYGQPYLVLRYDAKIKNSVYSKQLEKYNKKIAKQT